jgi:acylglycerol lipase
MATPTTATTTRPSVGSSGSEDDRVPSMGGRQLRGQLVPPHLRYLEGKLRNARGQALFYLGLAPLETPLRAVVVFMHALGDHSRRYAYLFEHLCDRGFAVVAYDLVGHGASDADDTHATRVHATDFWHLVDDTNLFVAFAKRSLLPALLLERDCDRRRYETPPIVLSGLSYGTLVGMHAALSKQHEFAALCLAGPSLNTVMTPVLKVQAVFARPLSLLLPRLRMVPAVNREWLCRDPGYFEDFDNDPLTNSELLTIRMGEQTMRAMNKLKRLSRRAPGIVLDVPVLFIIGSEDRVTSVPEAKAFFDALGAEDKEFKLFDGLYHCVFEDPERDDVMRYMTDWLRARFAPLPALKTLRRDQDKESEGEPEEEDPIGWCHQRHVGLVKTQGGRRAIAEKQQA